MADFPRFPNQSQFPRLPAGGGLPLPALLTAGLALLLVAGLARGVYTVGPESVGVVQRFGRFIGTSGPGLRFKLPFGIDTVTILPVKRQLKMEFGFGSGHTTNPDQVSHEQERERDMVTGDLNAAHVEWVVQYEISDPEQYLFNHREPGPTLRDLSESVMREVVGDRTVDEVLTIGRQGIENEAIAKLSEMQAELAAAVKAANSAQEGLEGAVAARRKVRAKAWSSITCRATASRSTGSPML